jgi:hypothetical protein
LASQKGQTLTTGRPQGVGHRTVLVVHDEEEGVESLEDVLL